MEKCIIAAVSSNWALGRNGKTIWNIPADRKMFATLTKGHPVIMGYNTFLSIGKPLPERTNIILYEDPFKLNIEGVCVTDSLEKAYRIAAMEDSDRCFVIGGGKTFAQAVGQADRIYMTHVDGVVTDADSFFPRIRFWKWKKVSESPLNKENEHLYRFVEYERRGNPFTK